MEWGDAYALDQLAPLVHRELREMARRLLAGERLAVGWQPTDLVQESYVRLPTFTRERTRTQPNSGTLAQSP
jgi:hypothetical protein